MPSIYSGYIARILFRHSLIKSKAGHRERGIRRFFLPLLGKFNMKNTGIGASNPKRKFQMPNSGFHLSAIEIRKLLNADPSARNAAIIRTLVETGIRRFELAFLETRDLDPAHHFLTIRHGKGNKSRQVPITVELLTCLNAIVSSNPCASIFRGRGGGRLSFKQINRIVAKAASKASLSSPNPRYRNVGCHLLRHSFARLWKSKNGSIESLSKILGHSSVKTTWDLYGTESLADVKQNYEKTIRKIFGGN
jgi:integrase